jgi:uncharacterized protein YjbJ (UPF0337 family)
MGNKAKLRNVVQTLRGKLKEGTGRRTGNNSLRAEGVTDQMKGNLKQAGEKVKDAFEE